MVVHERHVLYIGEPDQYDLRSRVNVTKLVESTVEPGSRFSLVELKDFPRCSICGDKSIGKQYGAYTCDGCKSFFRRSVRSRSVYTCIYGGGCEITMANRNHCRHCRMMKCLDVGMRVEAVQDGIARKAVATPVTDPTIT